MAIFERPLRRLVAAACCGFLATACGGGSGNPDGPPPTLLGAPKSPNPPPSASFDLHQHGGHGPLTVSVDAGASRDPEGGKLEYDWDFGDRYEAVGVAASHTYGEAGTFTIRLTVTDERGANAATDRSVTVEVEDLVCAPPP